MMSDSEIKSTVFPLRCSGVVVESGMKSLVITNPIVNAFFPLGFSYNVQNDPTFWSNFRTKMWRWSPLLSEGNMKWI